MSFILSEEWKEILSKEIDCDCKQKLFTFLNNEYNTHKVFPCKEKVFASINAVPIEKIKVVIIGQDPYHTEGQADGLAFSCAKGKPQPSLVNIKKEIESDLNVKMGDSCDLTPWAKQGVLLLNTSLSVREGSPCSHSNCGWQAITTKIIEVLNRQNQPIVFLLWGSHAKTFLKVLDNPKHLVLTAAHPSPLSAFSGFFGCKHFSKANDFLIKNNVEKINWIL